jgi:pimeloyl-ACP methyl ester carboxylesterase
VIRERFTTARGQVWSLERAGEGPRVLALHGVGGGAYFFHGLAARLGMRYEVTATDLPSPPAPGTGSDPVSMGNWAVDIAEIVDGVIGEPVAIVGHSLGAILALEVWRRRPDLVRAMVFVGGLPQVREAVRARLAERVAAIAAAGSMDGWGARVSPVVFGRRALEEKPEVVGLFERLLEAHDPGLYVRNMNALLAASATDVVPTVTVPCLSISGTEDVYAPPDFVSAFIARLPRPCDQVLLDGVGHMPFFEAPDEFAKALGVFLGDQTSPRTEASVPHDH